MSFRELVDKSDLSRYEIAKRIGYTFTTVTRFYTGEMDWHNASVRLCWRLATILDVPFDEFMNEVTNECDFLAHKDGWQKLPSGLQVQVDQDVILKGKTPDGKIVYPFKEHNGSMIRWWDPTVEELQNAERVIWK